jgi:hypothetical protein
MLNSNEGFNCMTAVGGRGHAAADNCTDESALPWEGAMITIVTHVTIWVKDQDEALKFYRDQPVFKSHSDDATTIPIPLVERRAAAARRA